MQGSDMETPAVLVRRAALKLLAAREHSYHELLEKLTSRYSDLAPDTVIRPVLDQLGEENLQSDQRFAQAFVRYRSSRGSGPLKIAAELYPRKLDAELLEQALYDSGIDWLALCRQALQKKLGPRSARAVLDPREKLQCQRFLQQRGFTHEQINQVLKSRAGNADIDEL